MEPAEPKEIVIPKDKAVFWMDGQGRWHNQHGPFKHKGIIDYFNAAIRKDERGFHVAQIRDGVCEKVYFRYEDTPLFVVNVELGKSIGLVLNTGRRIKLNPQQLFLRRDQLFLRNGGECIKFSERVLFKISHIMEYEDPVYFIKIDDRQYPISTEGD